MDSIKFRRLISTAAVLASTYKQIKKVAEQNGVKMALDEFHCKGSFGAMHKNHPDSADLSAAREFVQKFM